MPKCAENMYIYTKNVSFTGTWYNCLKEISLLFVRKQTQKQTVG